MAVSMFRPKTYWSIYYEHYDILNLMGKKVGSIDIPEEGYGFHHDLTWDNEGNVDCLATPMLLNDPENIREGIIYKYKESTGELVAEIDYGPWYSDAWVGLDSGPFDTHFNTLEYVPELDQLIVNSRTSSHFMVIDKYTLLPVWTVQNPEHPLLLNPNINLNVVNPDEFIYPNGAHTVFATHNKKYASYWGPGKVVFSIFDNAACKDEDGNFLVKRCDDTGSHEINNYPWDSACQIVAIDLNTRTIEQLDYLTVPGQRSGITSNVF